MRYDNLGIIRDVNGKQRYESVTLPVIQPTDNDIYIITTVGDRLDSLATKYYGNPRYWWIIMLVNELGAGTTTIQPGTQLRIPPDPQIILQQYNRLNS